jgi:hypothetical protein
MDLPKIETSARLNMFTATTVGPCGARLYANRNYYANARVRARITTACAFELLSNRLTAGLKNAVTAISLPTIRPTRVMLIISTKCIIHR